jgi:hypothetical protein
MRADLEPAGLTWTWLANPIAGDCLPPSAWGGSSDVVAQLFIVPAAAIAMIDVDGRPLVRSLA